MGQMYTFVGRDAGNRTQDNMRFTTNIDELFTEITALLQNGNGSSFFESMKGLIADSISITNELRFRFAVWLINDSVHGDMSEAFRQLDELLAFDPNDQRFILLQGFAEYKQGFSEQKTIEDVKFVIAQGDNTTKYYKYFSYMMALCYQNQEDDDLFLKYLLKSIAQNNSSVIPNRELANFYWLKGDNKEALPYFEKAIANVREVVEVFPALDPSDFDQLTLEYFEGTIIHKFRYEYLLDQYKKCKEGESVRMVFVKFTELDYLLFFLLVNKKFQDSYNLVKVFSWKFGIIEFTQLSKELKDKGFCEARKIGALDHYSLTEKGVLLMNSYKEDFLNKLIEKYPGEAEFIGAL